MRSPANMVKLLAVAAVAVALAATSACMPSAFDNVVKKAPARTVSRPSSYGATDFGRIVVPLRADASKPAVAGRYLAAGTNGRGISVVELDAAGKATVRNVSTGVLGQLESKPVSSAVEAPTGPASGEGRVILGIPKFADATGRYFQMTLGADFAMNKGSEPACSDITNWGLAVAAGNIGGTDADDFAVLGEERVIVIEDGTTQLASSKECAVQLDGGLEEKYRLTRKMVVADVMAGKADEIVVGSPKGVGAGNVVILRKLDGPPTTVCTTPNLQCPLTIAAPEGMAIGTYEGKARFGYSVAVGDFNADGMKDLLVGAPPDRAFIYYGPLPDHSGIMMPPAVVPDVVLQPMDPTQAKEWGWSVAAVNIDGRGGDEAVVGDPSATVTGKVAAGQVTIFGIADKVGTILATLADTHPEDNAFFGSTVNGLRFCPAGCVEATAPKLVLVGSAGEVFTYFQIQGLVPELRKF